jgi:hypothetical protein
MWRYNYTMQSSTQEFGQIWSNPYPYWNQNVTYFTAVIADEFNMIQTTNFWH